MNDERFAACERTLDGMGASVQRARFHVPGRIEVFGKHTDYAGGRSILCTLERGFAVVAAPRADSTVRVIDAASGTVRSVTLDASLMDEHRDWGVYVATVARRVARNFPNARTGADIAFASDLPPASGMSSSSALIIAIFLALDAVNDLSSDPAYRAAITTRAELAAYLGTVENGESFGSLAGDRGAGTFGGSEDHTAILCSESGMLSQYAFCPVRALGTIALHVERTFVVAFSGVAAEKTGGAREQYNEAALAVRAMLTLWNEQASQPSPCLANAIDSAPDSLERLRALVHSSHIQGFTAARLSNRLEQFVTESYDIVPGAASAFAARNYRAVGDLAERSQRAAEALLGNQVAETSALVRMARNAGADAASAFGAGFGGSVWALVGTQETGAFATAWAEAYSQEYPGARARGAFIVTRPGPAAARL